MYWIASPSISPLHSIFHNGYTRYGHHEYVLFLLSSSLFFGFFFIFVLVPLLCNYLVRHWWLLSIHWGYVTSSPPHLSVPLSLLSLSLSLFVSLSICLFVSFSLCLFLHLPFVSLWLSLSALSLHLSSGTPVFPVFTLSTVRCNTAWTRMSKSLPIQFLNLLLK